MKMGDPERATPEEREIIYNAKVSLITIFPGSIEEYERFVEYKVEIIDTGRENKGVRLFAEKTPLEKRQLQMEDRELGNHLIEQGIEAIVNVNFHTRRVPVEERINYYGLPVRKKKER